MSTKQISDSLLSFITTSETALKDALMKEAKAQNEKFNNIVQSFIDNLNGRYKRHHFVFEGNDMDKTLYCYHRVTNELLYYWDSAPAHVNLHVAHCTKVANDSQYHMFEKTNLHKEISDFMEIMEKFETEINVSHYFSWDGKCSHERTEDSLAS